jgi:hypothetical protein
MKCDYNSCTEEAKFHISNPKTVTPFYSCKRHLFAMAITGTVPIAFDHEGQEFILCHWGEKYDKFREFIANK